MTQRVGFILSLQYDCSDKNIKPLCVCGVQWISVGYVTLCCL